MYTVAFVALLVGCVVAQPPQPHMPWNMENCNIKALQRCVSPLTSAMMRRGQDMSLTSSTPVNSVDEVCRLVSMVKTCVLSRLENCSPEATTAASAAFDAVDYLCVEARNETLKYVSCMQRDNNAMEFGVCVNSMMQAQMDLLGIRDPRNMQRRLCQMIEGYEQCAEQKAGRVCNEEALVTKFFSILNKGLSFLHCSTLGEKPGAIVPDGAPKKPVMPNTEIPEVPEDTFGPMNKNNKCLQRVMMSCVSPAMGYFTQGSQFTVDKACTAFERVEGCMTRAENMCGSEARNLFESLKRIFEHLCNEKKEEFREVSSCLMTGMTTTFNKCIRDMQGLAARGDFEMEKAHKSFRMNVMACRAVHSYTNCMGQSMEKRCGYKARDLLDTIRPELNTVMEVQMGLSCPTDMDRPPIDEIPEIPEYWHRRHHHHKALMIALPIVGVILLALIVAAIVAIVRRRGAARRSQVEKADLVKNDVLQQNLRFAITQTPKEKSGDGLKV